MILASLSLILLKIIIFKFHPKHPAPSIRYRLLIVYSDDGYPSEYRWASLQEKGPCHVSQFYESPQDRKQAPWEILTQCHPGASDCDY